MELVAFLKEPKTKKAQQESHVVDRKQVSEELYSFLNVRKKKFGNPQWDQRHGEKYKIYGR